MDSNTDESRFGDAKIGYVVLGALYVLVGLGLFVSLGTDWIALFTVVLVGILGLVVLSLAVDIRQKGLMTSENKLIGAFVLLAMGLLVLLGGFTDLPSEVVIGVVFLVGVFVPHLLLQFTDYGSAR